MQASDLLKKRLWHRCFPGNFVKLLKTTILKNSTGGCFWLTPIPLSSIVISHILISKVFLNAIFMYFHLRFLWKWKNWTFSQLILEKTHFQFWRAKQRPFNIFMFFQVIIFQVFCIVNKKFWKIHEKKDYENVANVFADLDIFSKFCHLHYFSRRIEDQNFLEPPDGCTFYTCLKEAYSELC